MDAKDSAGYYKLSDGNLLFGRRITSAEYGLDSLKDSLASGKITDGWRYFKSVDEARTALGVTKPDENVCLRADCRERQTRELRTEEPEDLHG